MSINPTKVSEIVTFMKIKYHLVDYIEKVKKEFENFNPKKYPWLEIISEFESALQQYCIVAKACGLEGQYDTDFSDKFLVTTLKEKLPMTLRKYIKKIRWESATATSAITATQQQRLKLPEAKTLEELNNLIIRAKENYDFENEGQQQSPHIDHGFKLNAAQQRDRSRYPTPTYPQAGKPMFNPTTTPRGYNKPGRGRGYYRDRGRGGRRNKFQRVQHNGMQIPFIYIPPTDVTQQEHVDYKDRPKYWQGLCTNSQISATRLEVIFVW